MIKAEEDRIRATFDVMMHKYPGKEPLCSTNLVFYHLTNCFLYVLPSSVVP
jgi:hypothetical protein